MFSIPVGLIFAGATMVGYATLREYTDGSGTSDQESEEI